MSMAFLDLHSFQQVYCEDELLLNGEGTTQPTRPEIAATMGRKYCPSVPVHMAAVSKTVKQMIATMIKVKTFLSMRIIGRKSI